jgi:hypothetical protein
LVGGYGSLGRREKKGEKMENMISTCSEASTATLMYQLRGV